MNEIKVSVIIPVYNAEKHLKQCLDSIINQSLKELEVICVDDCSIDNSIAIIKDFSKKDDRVKYFSMPENSGAGPARNKGIEHATGKYISFIDSDDSIIDNTAYEKLYEFAKEKNADVVSANFKIYEDGKFNKSFYTREIDSNSQLLPEDYGIPWFFWKNLYKNQFLKENDIKFPSYRRGEDPVFLAEVLKKVDIIHCLPIDFYAYKYTYQTTPYKVTDKDSELIYIKHYKTVFEILDDSKFTNTCLEYEKLLYEFIMYQKSTFLSKSIDDTIKSIFGKDSKVLINYKYKCSLENQKKLEYENKLLQNQLNTAKKELITVKKELGEYLTIIGYLKYKSKNIITRLKNKLKWSISRKNPH